MGILAGLIAAAGVAAVPAAVAAWVGERVRSRRRNAGGRCATCARAWADCGAGEHFLIHGRLVCERCAARARERILWHFGLLTAFGLFATGMIVLEDGLDWFALLPPAWVALGTVGAAALMKLQNRRAQRQIAVGSYPFLMSGGAVSDTGADVGTHPNSLPPREGALDGR